MLGLVHMLVWSLSIDVDVVYDLDVPYYTISRGS